MHPGQRRATDSICQRSFESFNARTQAFPQRRHWKRCARRIGASETILLHDDVIEIGEMTFVIDLGQSPDGQDPAPLASPAMEGMGVFEGKTANAEAQPVIPRQRRTVQRRDQWCDGSRPEAAHLLSRQPGASLPSRLAIFRCQRTEDCALMLDSWEAAKSIQSLKGADGVPPNLAHRHWLRPGARFSDLHGAISVKPDPPAPWRVRESACEIAAECSAKSRRAVADRRHLETSTDTPVSQIAPHPFGHFRTTDCWIRWLRQTRTGLETRCNSSWPLAGWVIPLRRKAKDRHCPAFCLGLPPRDCPIDRKLPANDRYARESQLAPPTALPKTTRKRFHACPLPRARDKH
jgi:hypothetical protein